MPSCSGPPQPAPANARHATTVVAVTVSGSSPTRRSRADIDLLKAALYLVTSEIRPASVRQIYYQMVSRGYIAKTEGEYKNTVCRLLGLMRKAGEMPYGWITDNTRFMRKPTTYSNLGEMLEEQVRFYRRDLWHTQPVDVEVWLEKDALSGVLYPVTEEWDVPLMVTRGYPSLTFLYGAAEEMESPTGRRSSTTWETTTRPAWTSREWSSRTSERWHRMLTSGSPGWPSTRTRSSA